jgi:hypothetical protein
VKKSFLLYTDFSRTIFKGLFFKYTTYLHTVSRETLLLWRSSNNFQTISNKLKRKIAKNNFLQHFSVAQTSCDAGAASEEPEEKYINKHFQQTLENPLETMM